MLDDPIFSFQLWSVFILAFGHNLNISILFLACNPADVSIKLKPIAARLYWVLQWLLLVVLDKNQEVVSWKRGGKQN